RFDLGRVYEELKMHERAVSALEGALGMAKDHPAADSAWRTLAYAYAHLDRPDREREAYAHYLELETSPALRATAVLNVAEADMRLGQLDDAVAGYRDAIHLSFAASSSTETGVLAVWGLAVALDRRGDATEAATQAKKAVSMDVRRVIEDKN